MVNSVSNEDLIEIITKQVLKQIQNENKVEDIKVSQDSII